MRVIFMGTPDFAVPALSEILAHGHEVAAVYTQPPRAAGRGMAPRKSPVQLFAEANGLEVRHPASLKDPVEQLAFSSLQAEAAVVAAYGLLLPQAVLDAPLHGCFNIHASLLPRWRGAAPIQRAIMAGDTETGVSIMRMEAGLDTGPVCLVEHVPIGDQTIVGELHDTLASVGASLMVRGLAALSRGALACESQPESGVTYAQKITKMEAHLDMDLPAAKVLRRIHGLSPFPGAWLMVGTEDKPIRLKVLRAEPVEASGPPGQVLDERLTIACAEGAVRPLLVQREGKGPMDATSFLRGTKVRRGGLVG